MPRRSGATNKFWNNAAVGINGVSTAAILPRGSEQIAIYVTVSAATTISVEVAHHGNLTADGQEPDQSSPPANFFQLYYIDSPVQIVFASAGSAAIIIPDFEPEWVRLRSSAAATITAGYEITGE